MDRIFTYVVLESLKSKFMFHIILDFKIFFDRDLK